MIRVSFLATLAFALFLLSPAQAAPVAVDAGMIEGVPAGDVTVYKVETPGGARVEALLANSQSGDARFFEVGDAVEMTWAPDAGHFIAE